MKRAAFNQGGTPTIAFVNLAKTPLGVDLPALVAACQKALDEKFTPVWNTPAKLIVADKLPANAWGMLFIDNADEAGALGYHDLTPNGLPSSKVFVQTTIEAGESVSVTTSHELFEMLIDPGIQLWADGGNGTLYAYEASDAVEETTFKLDGVELSNFVYPSFFEPFRKLGSVKFDQLGLVKRPLQTLKGGYQIVMKQGRQSQVFGSRRKEEHFRLREDRFLHRSYYRRHPRG